MVLNIQGAMPGFRIGNSGLRLKYSSRTLSAKSNDDDRVTFRDVGTSTITEPSRTTILEKKKRKSTAFCQRCSDFAAGWGQIRRDESGRKLESLRIKSNQLNPLQHKSHPPETRCSRRETSLAFSTSPLHSIPPSLFCHPFPTKPELPPAPQSNTKPELLLLPCFLSNSCCCCFTSSASTEQPVVSSNVCTHGGRRLHGRDREGAAGPPRPHLQQELRAHHTPPRVRPHHKHVWRGVV